MPRFPMLRRHEGDNAAMVPTSPPGRLAVGLCGLIATSGET